mmetsp:Transcript_9401/g.20722  ORF Transcript_9401/g.20722 Transcript_9401/m.20722 type:complete len:170 (+) Transcript_9401:101-610(+)
MADPTPQGDMDLSRLNTVMEQIFEDIDGALLQLTGSSKSSFQTDKTAYEHLGRLLETLQALNQGSDQFSEYRVPLTALRFLDDTGLPLDDWVKQQRGDLVRANQEARVISERYAELAAALRADGSWFDSEESRGALSRVAEPSAAMRSASATSSQSTAPPSPAQKRMRT